MTYKILSLQRNDETITLNIEYTFDDESIEIVDVSVFAPINNDDVIAAINNRAATLVTKKVNAANVETIKTALESEIGQVNLIS